LLHVNVSFTYYQSWRFLMRFLEKAFFIAWHHFTFAPGGPGKPLLPWLPMGPLRPTGPLRPGTPWMPWIPWLPLSPYKKKSYEEEIYWHFGFGIRESKTFYAP
jgi:hypothetical protein